LGQAHRALLAGGLNSLQNLILRVVFAPTVLLNDEGKVNDNRFDSGIAILAFEAFSTPTNLLSLVVNSGL
jgi:hypothetical protein